MYGEARSQLLGSCKHTKMYEFRPFAEEVTALRLGARRRSTRLYACELQGVRTLHTEEGGGLYRVCRPPPALSNAGFKVHLRLGVTDNAPNKVL